MIELSVFVVIFGFKGHDESKTERAVVKAYLRKSSYCSPKSLKSFSRQNPKRTWQPLDLYKFTSFPRVERRTPMCNLIHLPVA